MSNPIVDQAYEWKGFGDGLGTWDSFCRLRIWQPHPEQTIVMLSDAGLDSGTSITNCIEFLAPLVANDFNLDPDLIDWIEHYPGHRQQAPEAEFSRIHLQWDGRKVTRVEWSPLTRQKAEALVDQVIE